MAQPIVNGRVKPHQCGFAYLLALLMVTLLGLGLGAAGSLWQTEAQRIKESELLYIGETYRQAISRYYHAPGPVKQYPKSLEALLLDDRQPALTRHLRKLYPDPLTKKQEWGLVVDADSQQIRGVYSLAPGAPLKQHGFPPHQREFEEAKSYAAWQFVVTPIATSGAPKKPSAATPPPKP